MENLILLTNKTDLIKHNFIIILKLFLATFFSSLKSKANPRIKTIEVDFVMVYLKQVNKGKILLFH